MYTDRRLCGAVKHRQTPPKTREVNEVPGALRSPAPLIRLFILV